ncbi:hypothetical protein ACAD36_02198 [Clavibacter nebraskensis]
MRWSATPATATTGPRAANSSAYGDRVTAHTATLTTSGAATPSTGNGGGGAGGGDGGGAMSTR